MKKTTSKNFIIFGLVIFLCNIQIVAAGPVKPYMHVPSVVEIGDILFMDTNGFPKKTPYIFHTALYIGDNDFIHIIPKDQGEDIVIWDWNIFYYSEWVKPGSLKFYRVDSASETQILNAIGWIYDRQDDGATFQDWFYGMRKISDPNYPHPTANMFYCSELPWAAYYDQGIDIDFNGWWPLGYENSPGAQVWKFDIIHDSDTSLVWP